MGENGKGRGRRRAATSENPWSRSEPFLGFDPVVCATSTPALFSRHGKSSEPAEPERTLSGIENRLFAASF